MLRRSSSSVSSATLWQLFLDRSLRSETLPPELAHISVPLLMCQNFVPEHCKALVAKPALRLSWWYTLAGLAPELYPVEDVGSVRT